MVKNQHLLLTIAVFGLGSAIACLILIISERTNSVGLASLANELQDARKELQARSDARLAETNQKLATLEKQHADLLVRHANLETTHLRLQSEHDQLAKSVAATQSEVRSGESFLKSLKQKRWLAEAGDVAAPWDKQVKACDDRLKVVEDLLKMLLDAKKKEKNPASADK